MTLCNFISTSYIVVRYSGTSCITVVTMVLWKKLMFLKYFCGVITLSVCHWFDRRGVVNHIEIFIMILYANVKRIFSLFD